MIDTIKEVLEEELKNINVCSVELQDGEYVAELEFYSDAGEDFVFSIWFDGTWNDFVEKFREYAMEFDPDEHAEMYVDLRGQRGVPSSIRTLIEDADGIKECLEKLSDGLKYDKYDDEWNEVEQS